RHVPRRALLGRGLLAGAAVGVAVAIGGAGFPLLAGMASVFPAIFLTTMVSLWLAQGEAVPLGAVGPMILGSTSIAGYALAALGPGLGAAAAWVVGAGVSVATLARRTAT